MFPIAQTIVDLNLNTNNIIVINTQKATLEIIVMFLYLVPNKNSTTDIINDTTNKIYLFLFFNLLSIKSFLSASILPIPKQITVFHQCTSNVKILSTAVHIIVNINSTISLFFLNTLYAI